MRTLAIANQKGGSAKTTTAVNLAATLGERGCRVLLLDLDPQASASQWYGVTNAGRGLLDVLVEHGTLEALVQPTGAAGVDLVPASTWLVGVEKVKNPAASGGAFRAGGHYADIARFASTCPSAVSLRDYI